MDIVTEKKDCGSRILRRSVISNSAWTTQHSFYGDNISLIGQTYNPISMGGHPNGFSIVLSGTGITRVGFHILAYNFINDFLSFKLGPNLVPVFRVKQNLYWPNKLLESPAPSKPPRSMAVFPDLIAVCFSDHINQVSVAYLCSLVVAIHRVDGFRELRTTLFVDTAALSVNVDPMFLLSV